MTDKATSIDRLRERIAAGGAKHYYEADGLESREIDPVDADRLLEFSDRLHLLRTEYSDDRHQKLLNSLVLLAEHVGGLADALEDRGAAEDLLRWIHATYPNEETNRDYRIALRVFGQRVDTDDVETDRNGIPLALSWLSSTTSSTYDPAPEPADMLRLEEDVRPMLEATYNDRDAALIALAFDAGPRGGELYDIRVGDITEGDERMRVTVRGRRGKRTVGLIPARDHVVDWLARHPGDGPAAPLWSRLHSPEKISYRMFLDAFKEVADRAGVSKTVTPTNFRKSSAAHLASNGMTQSHLEDHHGWVVGSKSAARYVSIFGDRASRELARIYGEASDEPADTNLPAAHRGPSVPLTDSPDAEELRFEVGGAAGDAPISITIQLPNHEGRDPVISSPTDQEDHPMPPTDPDLRQHILDAIRQAPKESVSDGTLHGLLLHDDREVSKRDVQRAAAELVDAERLEVAGRKGPDRQYRIPGRADD